MRAEDLSMHCLQLEICWASFRILCVWRGRDEIFRPRMHDNQGGMVGLINDENIIRADDRKRPQRIRFYCYKTMDVNISKSHTKGRMMHIVLYYVMFS